MLFDALACIFWESKEHKEKCLLVNVDFYLALNPVGYIDTIVLEGVNIRAYSSTSNVRIWNMKFPL
jgi:hypothetical protein